MLALTAILILSLYPINAKANIQKTWQTSSTGMHELDINFVLADPKNPDIVYAGTNKAVYKTTSGGKYWKWILRISGSEKEVNYIWIPPDKENYVYVASENGLYISTNKGRGWELIYKGNSQDTRNCLCVATSGNKIFVGTKSGLFKSSDLGRTWHREGGSLGKIEITSIAIDPSNLKNIFIASEEGVYRNTNKRERVYALTTAQLSEEDLASGETQAPKINHITVDPKNPNHIFLATNNGIIFSSDAGSTWSKFNANGLLTQSVRFLLAAPDKPNMYAATYRGIFEYQNDKWRELYRGIFSKNIRNLSIDAGGNLWAATDQSVFKTTPIKLGFSAKIFSNADIHIEEPTIVELQKAVIQYADVVDPKKIDHMRLGARLKYLLPSVDVDYSRSVYGASSSGKVLIGPLDWTLGLSWDVGDLIWSTEQRYIDGHAEDMIELRDDLLDKVTRYYFEWKRLKLGLLATVPQDEQEMQEKELRLEELTAYIDALTGGYFSQAIERNLK